MGLFPVSTATGMGVMSLNLLSDRPDDPAIRRGPLLAKMVKQFREEVVEAGGPGGRLLRGVPDAGIMVTALLAGRRTPSALS